MIFFFKEKEQLSKQAHLFAATETKEKDTPNHAYSITSASGSLDFSNINFDEEIS